jgi:hypothetical protein
MGEERDIFISDQLENIGTGIMLLHMQMVYKEALDNNIISRAEYRNYLRGIMKMIKETGIVELYKGHKERNEKECMREDELTQNGQ